MDYIFLSAIRGKQRMMIQGGVSMTDRQILYALSLAETRSFSEVARRLYVAQPAISKQIAALEKEINVRIFTRTKRDVYITDCGQIMIDAFKMMRDVYERSLQEVRRTQREPARNLRLSFLHGLDIGNVIEPAMRRFKAEYPEISVSVNYKSHAEQNKLLQEGELDVIITLKGEAILHSDFDCLDLCEYENVIAVHKNHPLARKDQLTMEELRQETLMVATPEGAKGFAQYIEGLQRKLGVSPSAIQYLPDIESLFINVEAGLGIAYLSKTPRILSNTSLKLFRVDDSQQEIVAAWNKGESNTSIRIFLDCLLNFRNGINQLEP
jgi:DNA-binding transcriptional LysR family regulator